MNVYHVSLSLRNISDSPGGPNHNSYNNTLYHIDSTLALYAVIESNLESNACQGAILCINLTQVKCEKRRAYTLLFVKLELTEIIICHSTP